MNNLIKLRGERTDLDCVTLGPHGQFYLRAENGKSWLGRLGKGEMKSDAFNAIQGMGVASRVKFVDFGDNNHYLFRYT